MASFVTSLLSEYLYRMYSSFKTKCRCRLLKIPKEILTYIQKFQEIFLDRALPAQSQILVADSATETEKNANDDDSAVVLAGKMTLSVISLENGKF